jgi:hypothetical protein
MKRSMVAAAAGVALFASGVVVPSASADEPPMPSLSYTTPEPGANPAQACANSANVIIAQISVGGVVVEAFPLAEPGDMSRGACVSTLTRGELTTAAYVANCKVLENGFAMANPSGRPYPYAFYGDPDLTAKNRAGCVALLRMFHTSIV